jgi:hypothetical protein
MRSPRVWTRASQLAHAVYPRSNSPRGRREDPLWAYRFRAVDPASTPNGVGNEPSGSKGRLAAARG